MAGKQRRKTAADPKKALRAARARANKDKHEVPFLRLWQMMYPKLPVPERDYKFIPGRKFAIDFAFCDARLGVELHGGGRRGRHTTLMGHKNDCDKKNLAIQEGWRLLEFNVIHLKDMKAVVDFVAKVLMQGLEVSTRKDGR